MRLLTTAMPKSPIWKEPERLQKMLSGLMSITMTPWLCKKSKPLRRQAASQTWHLNNLHAQGAHQNHPPAQLSQ